jgi:hypothetical protein
MSSGDGVNYFGLSAINSIHSLWQMDSSPGLTVAQAFAIDSKTDDGLPQSGKVQANYLSSAQIPDAPVWAAGGGGRGTGSGTRSAYPSTAATPGGPTTCYDNNNSGSNALQQYSMGQNSGAGMNCALSFQFQ